MRNTLLPTVAIAIGLLACADRRTPTGVIDPGPTFDVIDTPPIFQDGFESGSLTSWDDGVHPLYHRIVTDAALAHSGSRLLEVTFPQGVEGTWLTKFLPTGYESIHLSYWVRFPDNWRGGGYLLGVYGGRTDNPWSAHGKAGVCPNGTNFFTTFLAADLTGDPGPVRFYTYHMNMPRSGTECWGDVGSASNYPGTVGLTRGRWHQVEFSVQANTPGQSNGVQRVWIDGVLRGEWSGLRFRETTDLVINSVQLVTYITGGAPQAQVLYIDDVVVRPVAASSSVASVAVSPATATVAVGGSTQLTATARDATGSPVTGAIISWTSSNPSVATVTSAGVVTGVAGGSATITASAGGQSGTAAITVASSGSAAVASVSIVPGSGTAQPGETLQFVATLRDAAGNVLSGRTVSWYSNHPLYATIDANGRATAHYEGTAAIVAIAEGIGASASLVVTAAPPPPPPPPTTPVAFVSITPTSGSVGVGQTLQFAATTRDAAGNVLTGRAVTWYSNHPGYATIDASGRATGQSEGSAAIVAISEGIGASTWLTVTSGGPPPPAPVATVTVSPSTGSIGVGQTLQLSATLRDAAGNILTGRPITWSSSASGVATVSSSGLVTAVSAGGPVTMTATSEGRSGTASVTVTAPPPPPPPAPVATVTVSPASANIAPGESVQLTATLRDAAGNLLTGRVVTWASSNPLIVTVAPTGLVAGVVAGGPVTITATSEGRSGSAQVTVTPPSVGTTLFESDWRTATGTSTTALRDGTKWTEWVNYGGPQLLSVVPASGLGFPTGMANVLRVLQMGEQDAEHVQLTNGIPAPQVGSHLYYRIYTRVDEAAQAGGSDHPVEPMPGSCPFLWTFKRSIGSTGWRPEWQFSNTPSEEWWSLRVQLQKNVVYRLEWHFHFITSSTFKFDTRIYDAAGTLLYTDADFLSGNFLNQTLAARDPNFRNTNNDCFRHLFVGNNGQANWTATNTYTYWGGVKVCRDGWCGAY